MTRTIPKLCTALVLAVALPLVAAGACGGNVTSTDRHDLRITSATVGTVTYQPVSTTSNAAVGPTTTATVVVPAPQVP